MNRKRAKEIVETTCAKCGWPLAAGPFADDALGFRYHPRCQPSAKKAGVKRDA